MTQNARVTFGSPFASIFAHRTGMKANDSDSWNRSKLWHSLELQEKVGGAGRNRTDA